MSGQCGDKDSNPIMGCEVSQIIEEGFVDPSQICAVEINPAIHRLNQQAYPQIKFINNDFYQAMEEAYAKDAFNPGFINLDTIQTPPMAAQHLIRIMRLLSDMKHTGPLMIVTNMVISGQHIETYTPEEAISCILDNEKIQRLLTLEWKHTRPFEYNGTGRSRTKMCSFLFAKKN
jgi:hypothetical protein